MILMPTVKTHSFMQYLRP